LNVVKEVNISSLSLVKRGKVRDIFSLDENLLIVSTDRISAFDWILPDLIPFKGIILNKIAVFWFNKLKHQMENHLITDDIQNLHLKEYEILAGRSMVVKKGSPIPVECIVRGYLAGSAWREYVKTGKIGEYQLPPDLREGSKLPEVLFTPTTKEEKGHDRNISFEEMKHIIGEKEAKFLKEKSILLYETAHNFLLEKEIIIADTKFEFGIYQNKIILIDEIFTPDSSRFWTIKSVKAGSVQDMDKEFVRKYLLKSDWDRNSPPPSLPPEIIKNTSQRYKKIYEIITGESIEKIISR